MRIESCTKYLPIFFINRNGKNVSAFLTQTNFIVNQSEIINCDEEYEVYVGDETEVVKKGRQIIQKSFQFSSQKLIQDETWFDTVQNRIEENPNYQIVRDLFSYLSCFFFFCFGIFVKKIRPKIKIWKQQKKKKTRILRESDPVIASKVTVEKSNPVVIEMISEINDESDCICKICNFKAKTLSGLKTHQSRKHKNK